MKIFLNSISDVLAQMSFSVMEKTGGIITVEDPVFFITEDQDVVIVDKSKAENK